jgi:hypothetical protein
MTWRYLNDTIVYRTRPDGGMESMLASALPDGEIIQMPSLDELKAKLLKLATAKRWEVETGGMTLPDGTEVQTGSDDQARITAVLVSAGLAGVEAVNFKSASGWVSLTIDQVRAIAGAIGQHVQACFDAERAHHEAIAAITSIEQAGAYDVAAGWPA